ncbi:4'-phosphopantetheinyl transferase family protein [Cupriavidus basilensis]
MPAAPIHVRVASVAGLAGQVPPARQWLGADEARRLDALRAGQRAAQFVAGRWIARQLLAQAYGGGWQDWTLSAAPDGPPLAIGPASAFLSLSHSGDHVACAVGLEPLGLDIERVLPRKGLDALVLAVSNDAERAALPALRPGGDPAAQREAFFQLWTLKEAWLKRGGGGLFQTMLGQAVAVSPAATPASANACTWHHGDAILAIHATPPLSLSDTAPANLRYWCLTPAADAS